MSAATPIPATAVPEQDNGLQGPTVVNGDSPQAVIVDDDFHPMDVDEHFPEGIFDNLSEEVEALAEYKRCFRCVVRTPGNVVPPEFGWKRIRDDSNENEILESSDIRVTVSYQPLRKAVKGETIPEWSNEIETPWDPLTGELYRPPRGHQASTSDWESDVEIPASSSTEETSVKKRNDGASGLSYFLLMRNINHNVILENERCSCPFDD